MRRDEIMLPDPELYRGGPVPVRFARGGGGAGSSKIRVARAASIVAGRLRCFLMTVSDPGPPPVWAADMSRAVDAFALPGVDINSYWSYCGPGDHEGSDGVVFPGMATLTSATADFLQTAKPHNPVVIGDYVEVLEGVDQGFHKITAVSDTVLTVENNFTQFITGLSYRVSKTSNAQSTVILQQYAGVTVAVPEQPHALAVLKSSVDVTDNPQLIDFNKDDYLTAKFWNPLARPEDVPLSIEEERIGEAVNVAKPYALRRAPFDTKTIYYDSGSQFRFGIKYNYDESEGNFMPGQGNLSHRIRQATNMQYQGDDLWLENQALSPNYFEGEVLAVVPAATGLTSISGAPIKWLDANLAARAWGRFYDIGEL